MEREISLGASWNVLRKAPEGERDRDILTEDDIRFALEPCFAFRPALVLFRLDSLEVPEYEARCCGWECAEVCPRDGESDLLGTELGCADEPTMRM